MENDDCGIKIGIVIPTFARPDFCRATLLQFMTQTRRPAIVCFHQNGSSESYSWCIDDLKPDFEVIWLHTPDQLIQNKWYSIPLQRLVDEGCSHFFWSDHDDVYFQDHIETSISELESADYRVSRYTDVVFIRSPKFKILKGLDFSTINPMGGMASSMAFNRRVAERIILELDSDKSVKVADIVVGKNVLPNFIGCISEKITTRYCCHQSTVSTSYWLAVLDEET